MTIRSFRIVVLAAILLLAAAGDSMAQAVSEARGLITDSDGTPLKGVRVVFRNTAAEETTYETTTNKKGRFFIDNLLYYQNQEGRWLVSVEYPGYVATSLSFISRTQVRLVDKFTKNLEPGQSPPPLNIRPLGEAVLDFVMTPEDQLATVAEVEESDAAAEGPAAPQEDPWDRALMLANSGDLEEAVEYFDKAVRKDPDNAGRLDTYAKVLYQLQRYDEAEAKARAAIELDPSSVSTHMVLYSVHVARDDLDSARQELEEARRQDPGSREVLEQIAWLASRSGKPADAVAAYEAMTAANPEDVEAWVALGGLYAGQGMPDKSAEAYGKVVELDPDNAYQTFFNIGVLIENKETLTDEDNRRAVEAFRKAVEIKDDYAEAWRRLAFASLRTGDIQGARAGLEKYIALNPDSPEAAQVRAMLSSLPR